MSARATVIKYHKRSSLNNRAEFSHSSRDYKSKIKVSAGVVPSRGCVCVSHSVVSNSATPWTAARQAPLCMGFSRQEYWCGLPFPSPGDPSESEFECGSPCTAGRFFTI